MLNNDYPHRRGTNRAFNFWWLAQAVDARLDAFERTADRRWLDEAVRTYRNVVRRNRGSLFNDFFDDMLWLGLAALRLSDAVAAATDDADGSVPTRDYLNDGIAIWERVHSRGWNEQFGASLAWRGKRLDYKNAPANGPFAMLSCRLAERTADPRYLPFGRAAFDWLSATLLDPGTGILADGINREKDGRLDAGWRFTYNQGLYAGAATELFVATGDRSFLDRGARTAVAAIDELATHGVFRPEGDGVDSGLFKGIYYRYAARLLRHLAPDQDAARRLTAFIESSTDALVASSLMQPPTDLLGKPEAAGPFDPGGPRPALLLAADDWRFPPSGSVAYSTQLSAIMAIEVRARVEYERVDGGLGPHGSAPA